MDDELRQLAKAKFAHAKLLKYRDAAKKEVIKDYLEGIKFLTQIINKSYDDVFEISNTYYTIAIIYFNAKDYENSAKNYLQAITQLVQMELNDISYRKLTELYIDLADACYEMKNKLAGDDAMANAIKAFGLIQIKTREEKEIGDPIKNFEKFHSFYEKQLSSSSYRKSNGFLNHQTLLGKGQRDKQEEEALYQQIESLSLGEIKAIEQSIESMMSQLSVSAKPIFTPIAINGLPNDEAYRTMAMQLLSLAQNQFQSQSVSSGIATYKQVISTLNTIKNPNDSDRQIIQSLEQQVVYLKKKPTSSVSQPSLKTPISYHQLQTTYASTPGISFFPSTEPELQSSVMDEEENDYEMNLS